MPSIVHTDFIADIGPIVSAFQELGIKYIVTMLTFMSQIASQADFIRCDLTYDSSKEYLYIFNAVAFNNSSIEWIVVARIRLDAQYIVGYALCFKKLLEKCKSSRTYFELGIILQGTVIDWSDAEINGLKSAVGKEMTDKITTTACFEML